jgi:outer membrane protein
MRPRLYSSLPVPWAALHREKAVKLLRRHRFGPGNPRSQPTGIPKELFILMKRSLALIVTLASGFVLSAAAQTPAVPAASAAPTKIAIVAFQAAVAQTNEGQRNFADLQKKYDPKRQQLKVLSDEIDNLKKQLQAQGDKLSDAERATRAKTIDDKEKQLQRSAEDAQNDMNQEMQDLYNNLASKVYDVMASYAQEHGYTLVLDIAQQQNPVLYATPAIDISKAVVESYNTKSGVPAPPAPATASKAPAAAH